MPHQELMWENCEKFRFITIAVVIIKTIKHDYVIFILKIRSGLGDASLQNKDYACGNWNSPNKK